jgi:tetratricopeptide (TPR) repeat protein
VISAVLVATAKVVLAYVWAGREDVLREGGVQAIDLLANRGRRTKPVVTRALAAIETELDSVITAERIDPDALEPVLQTVRDLFTEHALTVDELADAGLDQDQAAAELLRRSARVLSSAGLSEQERYLVERATLGCYRAILSQPELLPGREFAFQRQVLADLADLKSQHAETRQASPVPEVDWPVLVGRVPPAADQYQPRPDLRRVLDEAPAGTTLVLTQERAGPGGVGKTQLAAAFARDQLAVVDVLVWVAAGSRDAILTAYGSALGKVRPDRTSTRDAEAEAAEWLSWLAAASRRWLVVLDDVADPRDVVGLWPAGPAGRTLITTRRRESVFSQKGRRLLPVGLFTKDESLSYLEGKLQARQLDQARELAEKLGHIPLALAQAASVIADNEITCAAYLRRLADQHNRLEALFPPDALADDYSRTVATTWLASVDAGDQLQPHGLASRLLRLAALLDPNGIPAELFSTVAILNYLDTSVDDVETSLQNLRRVSLADIELSDQEGVDGAVRVHELVQRASRETTGADQLAVDAQACADALLEIWPERDYQPALALRTATLRSNVIKLREHAGKDLWEPGAYSVLFRYGRSLRDSGVHALAIDYWSGLYNQAVTALGRRHPDTLTCQNNLALAYQDAGRVAEAIPLFELSLTDYAIVCGGLHPDTLTSRNNLAVAYQDAGRVAEAIPLLEQTLTDRVTVMGERHPDTLASRNNLAHAYGNTGRLAEAIPLLEQTFTDCTGVLGERHPNTLASRNNLAIAYWNAGRAAEAIPLFEQTLSDYVGMLGERHPDTLGSRNNLAFAYQAAGRLAEAIPLLEQTLSDCAGVLGERHPDTLTYRNNLASAYREAGRVDEADALLQS